MRIATYQPRLIYPDVAQMGRDTYEKGLTCFIDRFLEGYSSEVAFYQFGEVETPGVSDIDLLMVVKDEDWKQARHKAQSIIDSSGLLSFLFTHQPVVVCESLVPCLPILHTLENCKYVQGTWDPLAQVPTAIEDEGTRLMRHVVWNSFMRVAALELDNRAIGLRRVLSLMHNLLITAHSGNKLLSQPVSLSLSTEQIRSRVLSASPMEQESLAKTHIRQIVGALNDVDNLLDQELGSKMGFNSTLSPLILASRHRFLVSPLTLTFPEEAGGRWYDRILGNVQVVQLPAYLLVLVAILAHRIGPQFPQFAAFRALSIPEEFLQRFDVTLFAKHLKEALQISELYGIKYFSALPFAHRESTLSLKNQAMLQIRKKILSRRVRNW